MSFRINLIRTKVLALQATLAIMLALSACTPAGPSAGRSPDTAGRGESAASQRVLVIAVRGELPTLAVKPLVQFSGALNPPLYLFNAMLDYTDEQDVTQPMLAEALPELNTDTWRVFPDGRMETTYRLKPNLTWHDGTPLSAEDFVFGYQVYATPQFGSATSPPIGLMEEVVAPDERTVTIRWRQPYPEAAVLSQGTDIGLQALPRHILQEPFRSLDPLAFTGHPFWTSEYVGLGPYRVERWEPGAFIAARAFEGYVLGSPNIGRIELRIIPDPQTAVANLLAGETHFVGDFILSVTDGLTLEQQFPQRGGGAVLYSPVTLRSGVVQLRPEVVETPALLDYRVRRAVASGLDLITAVEVLTAGKSLPSHTLTHPKVPYYPEIERVILKHEYDPRRVQALMEESGYSKGPDGIFIGRDGQPVRFSVASSAGAKNEQEAATYVDSLRRAGFDANQRILPAAQIADPETRSLLPGLQIRGGGDRHVVYTSEQIARPENRWRGDNRGGWSNPAYDQTFAAYSTTLAREARIQQLAQLERILTEEVPVIPLFLNAETNAHVGALEGPVARHIPDSAGTFLHVHRWQWRS
jgi:peptide/nickel transport system substrate-binding protein